jgi:hypothetical protein
MTASPFHAQYRPSDIIRPGFSFMGFIELRGVNLQRAIETGEERRCLSVICCVLRSGFRHQFLFFHQEQVNQ